MTTGGGFLYLGVDCGGRVGVIIGWSAVLVIGAFLGILQQLLGKLPLVVANHSVHCTLTNAAKNSAVNSSRGDIPAASIATSIHE